MSHMPARAVLNADLSTDLAEQFAAAERIAWDIETSGLDWTRGKIGTCQLHAPEVGTVIVQITEARPERLIKLLTDRRVRKVFHYAPFDLRWMVGHWQIAPVSIDCTKLASRIVDKTAASEAHSLKYLLDLYLGVDIQKDQRLSDWLTDSLSDAQLAYAAADVEHLLPLLDRLQKELANDGHLHLYKRCSEFLPTRVELEVGSWPDVFGY